MHEERTAKRLHGFDSSIYQDIFKKQLSVKNPIDLSVGLPSGETPDYIKDAGIRAIQENKTSYAPANGIPELRQALAGKFARDNNISVTKDEVTVMPGLATGLLSVYLAVLNPGDEVMIMDPGFSPYFYLPIVTGAVVKRVSVLPNFQLDLAAIDQTITAKTKLILINTPNNPTGAVYPREDLEKLAEIASRHGTLIISDEIYESFVFKGEHFSIGSIYKDTITMNGFSKSHTMTGWRVGYTCGPRDVIDAINQIQQYTVFSASSIAQYAAIEALAHPTPKHEEYAAKNQLIIDKMSAAGYTIHGSAGAYYTLFEVPEGMDDMQFVQKALEQRVLLLPGRAFSEKENFVRISYGGTIEDVEKGLDIITKITP